ncbi:MAG: MBL fold metallo-hydrolase, partial [Kiritimatiellae bacterium]|nr:MBL fold metallo-hydrolase [Kiritimatiellia bacterium]
MPRDWIDMQSAPGHVARERSRARELRASGWWQRQVARGVCHYCGRSVPPAELTMDHVVPVARGGQSTKGNVVPCCAACNRDKRFLTPAEIVLAELAGAANYALPALQDNYIHLVVAGVRAVVVDPGDAAPVLSALREHRATLEFILLTHRHGDHTAGCAALREVTGCRVVGPAECAACSLDRVVEDGDSVPTGVARFDVLGTPGHTNGHVVYHAASVRAAWTGDTLFAAGCGRACEAPPSVLWQSLCRLRALPSSTR